MSEECLVKTTNVITQKKKILTRQNSRAIRHIIAKKRFNKIQLERILSAAGPSYWLWSIDWAKYALNTILLHLQIGSYRVIGDRPNKTDQAVVIEVFCHLFDKACKDGHYAIERINSIILKFQLEPPSFAPGAPKRLESHRISRTNLCYYDRCVYLGALEVFNMVLKGDLKDV